MKHINVYINEAWSGVKQQSIKADIEAWCEEMDIEEYTINSQGEIDVGRSVELSRTNLKELPYKFGRVNGWFDIGANKNLISLKNCPYFVGDSFGCDGCSKLDSLMGCPINVNGIFYCGRCKQKFTKDDVLSLCNAKKNIEV